MGLWKDIVKFEWGPTAAIGIGAVILAPLVVPMAGAVLKPLAKATIKGGMILFEKGRTVAAEAIETIEDLTAEAEAELAQERAESAGEAPAATE